MICVGGLIAWRVDGQEPAPATPAIVPPVPVVAAKVQVADFPIVMTGIGSVVAYNVVDVHAQVTGTIEKIGFVEGQTVHPGDLIAQLDPRPYQAALQQAEANLARDQAHLTNAQANLSRYVPLMKQGLRLDAAGHRPDLGGDPVAGGDPRRQGGNLQRTDAAQLHHDHLADRWRDRHSPRRYRQHPATEHRHADT